MCEIKIKDSELWEYAKEEFDKLTLQEKIARWAREVYPDRDNTNLTPEEKIDVVLHLPDPIKAICKEATPIESWVIGLLSSGHTYREVCQETGLKNRSVVRKIIKEFGRKIKDGCR